MDVLIFLLIGAAIIALAVLLTAYICYRMAFYNPKPKNADPNAIPIPDGEIYEPFREQMEDWVRWTRSLPQEDVSITSFDGLKLYGKFYEYAPGAPIELMFHGYRGAAERDLSGGVFRCFSVGRSALIVDQRSCGRSEGINITFGIKEQRDCLAWLDFAIKKFGPDCKIILTGISMGASTVLMAAGRELPKNVIGVLADCGFTSAKEIMYEVIRTMKLPPKLAFPFVKLGARIFAGFNLEETSAIEAVEKITVPVFFTHGETDDFVPCDMSRRMHEACQSRKTLALIPGAGHGLAFPIARDAYIRMLQDFFGPEASAPITK